MLHITPETIAFLRTYRHQIEEREQRKAERRAIDRTRQLSKAKFDALVEIVKPILEKGEPTKFQFEGTCRQAVRVVLIARGFTWRDADANALAVVSAGLKATGAVRPSWLQGQPEWRDRDTSHWRYRHCPGCGGILDEDYNGKHCSVECATVTRKRLWQRENNEKMSALKRAWLAANPEKRKAIYDRQVERADPRTCKQCGSTFKVPNSKKIEFCQPRCAYDWRSAQSAAKNSRPCDFCRGMFVPRSRGSRPRKNYYCSRACGFAAKRAGTSTIFECQEIH